MTTPLWLTQKILFLEDDPLDAELVVAALDQAAPGWEVRAVSSREDFVRSLHAFEPDVVLSDHAVASFDAFDALRLTQERRPVAAFLLVAGAFEETSAKCLKAGAANFVRKADLGRLAPAIIAALTAREPLHKLTERQLQVLQLIALGYSMRDAAQRLQLSVKTVETHRAELMKRLDIHEIAGLVRFAIRVGIIAADQ